MPTLKQMALIKALGDHSMFWLGCEDIDSPSHYIDLEDTREILMDEHGINKAKAEEFAYKMFEFLNFVREVN